MRCFFCEHPKYRPKKKTNKVFSCHLHVRESMINFFLAFYFIKFIKQSAKPLHVNPYRERPQEEKRVDSGERAPQGVEEDEVYDMPVVQTLTPLLLSQHYVTKVQREPLSTGSNPPLLLCTRCPCFTVRTCLSCYPSLNSSASLKVH